MEQPNRNYTDGTYRYGFNGMEKDDELKGKGNNYTTHFRQLDSRLGRWLSRDPKVTAFESPYISMGNKPITYNDIKGDTIKLKNFKPKELDTYLKSDEESCNCVIDYSQTTNKDGTVNALYKGFTSNTPNEKNKTQEVLNKLISHKETLTILVGRTTKQIDNIERYGGAVYIGDAKTIGIADHYFYKKNHVSLGGYYYLDKDLQANISGDKFANWIAKKFGDYTYTLKYWRTIPLPETIRHEIYHAYRHFMGKTSTTREEEENTVINHVNEEYRKRKGIPLRPPYGEDYIKPKK